MTIKNRLIKLINRRYGFIGEIQSLLKDIPICIYINQVLLGIFKSYQIKLSGRGSPAASLLHSGDDLMKPEYQWGFQTGQFHLRGGKKKSDTHNLLAKKYKKMP